MSAQKPSGSSTERSYISSYSSIDLIQRVLARPTAGGWMTRPAPCLQSRNPVDSSVMTASLSSR